MHKRSDKLLLCIVGMPGSGKTKAKEFVLKNFPAAGVSSGDIIRDEIRRRGLKYSPTADAAVAAWFHTDNRETLIAHRVWEKVRRVRKPIVVIEGLRSLKQLRYLERISGFRCHVIAVDAPFKVRAARELARGRFGRAETLEYLRQRDRDETRRGVKRLIAKAGYRINVSRLPLPQFEGKTVALVRKLAKKYHLRGL